MTLEQIAKAILWPLWQGIPREYKMKYSYSIWQQFEDNVRSAAYTSRLSLFLSRITARLGISILDRDVARITEAIDSGQDREILRSLRDDTALLVLLVRAEAVEMRARKQSDSAPLFGGAA